MTGDDSPQKSLTGWIHSEAFFVYQHVILCVDQI